MKIILAKTAGFCFGVKRAVDAVYEQIEKGGKIYTYGPVIHNESVVDDLKSRGVTVLETKEELMRVTDGTVILRSHGVKKEIHELLKEKNIPYVDTACPFVKRIHKLVEEESKKGKRIVIVGNKTHPEVEAIESYSVMPPIVLQSVDEMNEQDIPKEAEYFIVSQTTFNDNKFQEIVDNFEKKGYYYNVVNTICSATKERQTEAKEIAGKVDAMIVIGGSHSSNSRKLYEICSKECDLTFFIQTMNDLHLEQWPKSVELVGITAGASTPNNIIEEVQNHVRTDF